MLWSWNKRDKESIELKETFRSQNFPKQEAGWENSSVQTHTAFYLEEKDDLNGGNETPESGGKSHGELFLALRNCHSLPRWIPELLRTSDPCEPRIFLFWAGTPTAVTPHLPQHRSWRQFVSKPWLCQLVPWVPATIHLNFPVCGMGTVVKPA